MFDPPSIGKTAIVTNLSVAPQCRARKNRPDMKCTHSSVSASGQTLTQHAAKITRSVAIKPSHAPQHSPVMTMDPDKPMLYRDVHECRKRRYSLEIVQPETSQKMLQTISGKSANPKRMSTARHARIAPSLVVPCFNLMGVANPSRASISGAPTIIQCQ